MQASSLFSLTLTLTNYPVLWPKYGPIFHFCEVKFFVQFLEYKKYALLSDFLLTESVALLDSLCVLVSFLSS
jgi:hypothetical protein